jgi:hypothetical protein
MNAPTLMVFSFSRYFLAQIWDFLSERVLI